MLPQFKIRASQYIEANLNRINQLNCEATENFTYLDYEEDDSQLDQDSESPISEKSSEEEKDSDPSSFNSNSYQSYTKSSFSKKSNSKSGSRARSPTKRRRMDLATIMQGTGSRTITPFDECNSLREPRRRRDDLDSPNEFNINLQRERNSPTKKRRSTLIPSQAKVFPARKLSQIDARSSFLTNSNQFSLSGATLGGGEPPNENYSKILQSIDQLKESIKMENHVRASILQPVDPEKRPDRKMSTLKINSDEKEKLKFQAEFDKVSIFKHYKPEFNADRVCRSHNASSYKKMKSRRKSSDKSQKFTKKTVNKSFLISSNLAGDLAIRRSSNDTLTPSSHMRSSDGHCSNFNTEKYN